jgi:predicted dienelactone hydrolase
MTRHWAKRLVLAIVIGLCFGPGTACAQSGLPVGTAGPYAVGVRTLHLADALRPDRDLTVEVWYPATTGSDEQPRRDSAPLTGDGPYPLLVISHGNGGTRTDLAFLAVRLASLGFVVAAPDHLDAELGVDGVPTERVPVDRPLDVLAVINGLSGTSPLGRLIETDRVGVIGYSLGGFTALTLSGARIDPAGYLAACARPEHAANRVCMYAPTWAATESYRPISAWRLPRTKPGPLMGTDASRQSWRLRRRGRCSLARTAWPPPRRPS